MWFQASLNSFCLGLFLDHLFFRTFLLLLQKSNFCLRILRQMVSGILESADLKDERLLPSINDQVNHDYHEENELDERKVDEKYCCE